MSSSKEDITRATIARLEANEKVQYYKTHCENVEKNKDRADVKKYWNAKKTFDTTKVKDAVKKFISARGGKASKKELDKLRNENKNIPAFEEAEKVMSDLAHEDHVKTHREAEGAKTMMEEVPEVVEYNMAVKSLKDNEEKNKAKKLLPQPKPRERKPDEKLRFSKHPWGWEKEEGYLPMKAPMPSPAPTGDSSKTTRGRSRDRSRDRSEPQTSSKTPASAPEKPKINSGKNRRVSPHTDKERDINKTGVNVVRSKAEAKKWKLP
ncbi:uncharacterized protein EAE97_010476 [Botrytis byssoidea]|uniref:Uncharacterized protein n=1 Tax=Botrytis byssoidea TaxID=139641 RepID=A0A9P5I4U2_9HELO|nr:uncharacterized protein EAE97_010476 [Botrytis byssoidea]KAF7925395.1 hypothetical protein EAE97_010476 [Botrytis byssoidea]